MPYPISSLYLLFCSFALSIGGSLSFAPPLLLITNARLSSRATAALNSISSEVAEEMKTAMKAKDTATLGTIRLIRSAFSNAQIDLKTEELSDEQVRGFRN